VTLISLQALTWSTITGAVVSALLLASGEPGMPEWSRARRSEAAAHPPLPAEPTRASARRPAATPRVTAVSETTPREIEPR
jgi:hypothetical protein